MTSSVRIAVALIALIAFAAAVPADPPAPATSAPAPLPMPAFVYGLLTQSDGVTPVARITVFARAESDDPKKGAIGMTNDQGAFCLNKPLLPGQYRISLLAAMNFIPVQELVVTADTGPTALRLKMPAGSLSGTVFDASGEPADKATVVLSHPVNRISFSATTNDTGGYRLEGVPPGHYSVSVSLLPSPDRDSGLQTHDMTFVGIADQPVTRDFELKPIARRTPASRPRG